MFYNVNTKPVGECYMQVTKNIFIMSMLAAGLMGCVSDNPKAYSPAPIIEKIKLP